MDIQKNFTLMKELGLQQEAFYEKTDWDELVSSISAEELTDKRLKEILRCKRHEEHIDTVTLDGILSSNFAVAKATIDQMTIAKRIKMLEDVYQYRDYLYSYLERYGGEGYSKDEQIGPADFRMILGKIKHVEILQNWLYGIV